MEKMCVFLSQRARKSTITSQYVHGESLFKSLYSQLDSFNSRQKEKENLHLLHKQNSDLSQSSYDDQRSFSQRNSSVDPPVSYGIQYMTPVQQNFASTDHPFGRHDKKDHRKEGLYMRSVDLKEICSFVGAYQYCIDNECRVVYIPLVILSMGMIWIFTLSLYLNQSEEYSFLIPAVLLYAFGVSSGKAFFTFLLSLALYRLPKMVSFVIQDEKGKSLIPSPVEWEVGTYKVSSKILFPIAISLSYVRMTFPLQVWLLRTVFRV